MRCVSGRKEGRKEGRKKERWIERKKKVALAGTKMPTFPSIWRSPSTGTFSASAKALKREDFPPPFMPE